MERFEHGGNIYAHTGVVDFSASLNPLGMPDQVKHALTASLHAFEVYPDPASTQLTEAIAAWEAVDTHMVCPCAGATDALFRISLFAARKGTKNAALVCDPCYSGYEQAAEQAGITIIRYAMHEEDHFQPTPQILNAITGELGLIFLANPNNPTGCCIERELLCRVLDCAQQNDTLVVVDECFIDLTEAQGSNDLLEQYRNLIVVKAATKTFALAGLRLGYSLCASRHITNELRTLGQPWAVSSPAQIAGVAALHEQDYIDQARNLIRRERTRLQEALGQNGLRCMPSQANYLLFSGPEKLQEAFLEQGILIRSCANFHGLGARWYRIAVRTPQENEVFIEALRRLAEAGRIPA